MTKLPLANRYQEALMFLLRQAVSRSSSILSGITCAMGLLGDLDRR